MWRQPRLRWALAFLGCTFIALFFASQTYLSYKYSGGEAHWGIVLKINLCQWYAWGLFAPGILWLARRFPFEHGCGTTSLGVHLLAGTGVALPSGRIALDPVTGDWRSFRTPLDGTGIFVTPLGRNGSPLQYSMAGGGNLGRNAFRGPGLTNWNLSLMKAFSLTERWKLQLSAEWSNLLNHRNFGPPVSSMNSGFGANTSVTDSRVAVLVARIRF